MPGRRASAADHGSRSATDGRPDQTCRRGFAFGGRQSGREPVTGSRRQPEAGRLAGCVAERCGSGLTLASRHGPRDQL
jgi:hypothetical protein